jgi:hypothetical protein
MVRAHGRLPPVAVRAPHLALTDLGVDRRDAAAVPRELRDRGALRPDVIELEHDGIALSAIDARVCAQEAQDVSQVPVDARIRARLRRLAGRDAPHPPRSAVLRRWQFAQTTSQRAISLSMTLLGAASESSREMLATFAPMWSNSRTTGSRWPHSTHGVR